MKYPGFFILVLVMLATMVLPLASPAGTQAHTIGMSQWQTFSLDSTGTGVVEPDMECTIETQDGTIIIAFPSGSVSSATEVTISKVLITDAPPPPNTYQYGATCFAVTGVSSLEKKATITIRYTEDDLVAADRNADSLVLSRHNENTGEWEVIHTTMDKEAQILTATTDKFSYWMVMVAPGPVVHMWIYGVALIVSFAVLVIISMGVLKLHQRIV